MDDWSGKNRRKFPRAKYPCLVTIRHAPSDGEDTLLTHTENIGIGGICITLKQNVKLFSPVEIELDLLDLDSHIRCSGKIVWSIRRAVEDRQKPLFYDVGIEFKDLGEDEVKRLDRIVHRLIKDKNSIA